MARMNSLSTVTFKTYPRTEPMLVSQRLHFKPANFNYEQPLANLFTSPSDARSWTEYHCWQRHPIYKIQVVVDWKSRLGCKVSWDGNSKISKFNLIYWNSWSADEVHKHMSRISLVHFLKIWNLSCIEVKADIAQIGPGCVILYLKSSFGRIVIIQTLTPVEPLKQKLCHYFYGPRHLAWFIKFTIIAESINVARDIMIWNRKQFISNPVLPKEDKLIKRYRTWFSQFYSENSKTFEMARNDLSWWMNLKLFRRWFMLWRT